MDITIRKLGCIEDPRDDRDFMFKMRHRAADLPKVVEFPLRISWVYDQGDEGSCVGHGIVTAFRNALLLNNQPDVEFSRQMAYYIARRPYYKNRDSGACIRDAIKASKRYGICPESMWPYVLENMFTRPTDECYEEAEKHQLIIGERVHLDESEIKSAIAAGFGIVFGINVFESFFSLEAQKTGVIPIPNIKKEKYYGGHCMFLASYNQIEKGYYSGLNSWGNSWGDNGKMHIPETYFMEHARDLWAVHLTE